MPPSRGSAAYGALGAKKKQKQPANCAPVGPDFSEWHACGLRFACALCVREDTVAKRSFLGDATEWQSCEAAQGVTSQGRKAKWLQGWMGWRNWQSAVQPEQRGGEVGNCGTGQGHHPALSLVNGEGSFALDLKPGESFLASPESSRWGWEYQTGEERSPKAAGPGKEGAEPQSKAQQSRIQHKALNLSLNLSLVSMTRPLSFLRLSSDGQCPFTVPQWVLGPERTPEGRGLASQDEMVGTGGGLREGNTASRPHPAWPGPSATFALMFASSAGLLPALKDSSKQLLDGPQGQPHKSRPPGLPPRGMSAARTEGGREAK